jgi:hypothetical protein
MKQPIAPDTLDPGLGKWRHRRWHLGWPRSQRMRGLMLLLAGTALIAVMDAVVKLMSTSLGTLQIAWGRYVVQAILLFLVISPRQSLHRLRAGSSPCICSVYSCCLVHRAFSARCGPCRWPKRNTIAFIAADDHRAVGRDPRRGRRRAAVDRRRDRICRRAAGRAARVRHHGLGCVAAVDRGVSSAVYPSRRLLARSEDPANTLYFVALVGAIGLSVLVPFFWTPLTAPLLLGMVAVGTLARSGIFS